MPLRALSEASARARRGTQRARNAAVAGALEAALSAAGRVSLERALQLSEGIGTALYRLLGTSRRRTLHHLDIAFGHGLQPAAREHVARASFVNIARSICELAKIDAIRACAGTYFEVDGWEHTEQLRTGAVMVTGLIGNWELLAAYFAWQGIPVASVARRLDAGRLQRRLIDYRERQGIETILREGPHAAQQILRVLTANGLLAVVIDQETRAAAVSIPFFGRLAHSAVAAASLAIRSEIPALPVFIQRRAEGGHRITVNPPCRIEPSGDQRADGRTLTHRLNSVLEAQIRRNPAEWVWWPRRAPATRLAIDPDFQYTAQDTVLRHRG